MKVNSFVPSAEIFESNFNSNVNKVENSNNTSFSDTLISALNEINDKQVASENAATELVSGGDIDIADVMLASSEAKISLQLAVEVRNKLVSAYNELMNMSL